MRDSRNNHGGRRKEIIGLQIPGDESEEGEEQKGTEGDKRSEAT
jgi:hypothetical protein